ncbi:Uncharacterized membrane protein [Nocardioides alpinus]|uniref:DUF1269 domain-containing protein n=1 Tax=Nocardioides alpinus TaxID=748909 RepID=A0A1I1AVR1_9ACTN|nr:DUF1269 domain-containing protein [Nocardioides alpinus]PKH40930.1 DUF1269 domain-containing protein [Nocardioides alpinus]SFB42124.1 Uncharacterized membrane protein [Nocardioides alpinus]
MTTLTVWTFDTAEGAAAAARALEVLATEQALVLQDAAQVHWPEGEGKPRTRQLDALAGPLALDGAFWGMLFGLVFFMPLLGAAIGAASGAVSGTLAAVGIDDLFINRVRDGLTPGTSALFLLASDAAVDRVRDAFAGGDPAELVATTLDDEQERAVRQVFTH